MSISALLPIKYVVICGMTPVGAFVVCACTSSVKRQLS